MIYNILYVHIIHIVMDKIGWTGNGNGYELNLVKVTIITYLNFLYYISLCYINHSMNNWN